MSILIKGFARSIVGVFTVALFGCGSLFSSPPAHPNLYPDLAKAWELQYRGNYKAAIAKYQQALKKLPSFPDQTKVINISFPAVLKYRIAFCYVKLAEAEGDISLYSKAEAAAKASYETARLDSDQADALYLWGYLLFKQARYEEAAAKFEALLERLRQDAFNESFTADALFGLGKSRLHLGDNAAAQRIFAQLLESIEADRDRYGFYATEVLFGLGKVFIELGDEPTARRVFARLLEHIEIDRRDGFVAYDTEIFYETVLFYLGKTYLALGDEATARRVFAQLLEHHPDSPHKAEVQRLLD